MNRIETGVLRLYYVAWAAWVGVTVFSVIDDGYGGPIKTGVLTALATVAPYALMLVVRWVYRGFFPKPSAPQA